MKNFKDSSTTLLSRRTLYGDFTELKDMDWIVRLASGWHLVGRAQ